MDILFLLFLVFVKALPYSISYQKHFRNRLNGLFLIFLPCPRLFDSFLDGWGFLMYTLYICAIGAVPIRGFGLLLSERIQEYVTARITTTPAGPCAAICPGAADQSIYGIALVRFTGVPADCLRQPVRRRALCLYRLYSVRHLHQFAGQGFSAADRHCHLLLHCALHRQQPRTK